MYFTSTGAGGASFGRPARTGNPAVAHLRAARRYTVSPAGSGGRGSGRGNGGYRIPDQQDRKILEQRMKVNYDKKTDTLTVIFRDVPVAESDEDKPGVILDYDAAGNIVSIEVLDASRRVEDPRKVIVEAG